MITTIITNLEALKMGDLSRHFSRSEFACKDGCGFATVDVKLLELLEVIRKHFNKPVTITSGCRCEKHNKKIGGALNSKHMQGIAADIKVKDVSPEEVYKFVDLFMPNKYGIGLYSTWVHVDVREDKWRSK